MTRSSVSLLLAALLLGIMPSGSPAQDVEMLGARYGTRPPAAYYREMARDRDAYRFSRGRPGRIRAAASAGGGPALAEGGAAGPAGTLGPRDGPVTGNFAIPVLLGLFDDTQNEGPYSVTTIQDEYFADAPGTVRRYYDEVSGRRVVLDGRVTDWRRVGLTQSQVTRNDGALSSSTLSDGDGIGNFIYQVVQEVMLAEPGLDWGQFDNDGPDGVPNSGDDDGYVDAVAVIHPTQGAECDGTLSNIWSHKWNLSAALGQTIETSTTSANGGGIRIDDYFVGPVLSCPDPQDGSQGLNEIGILTHEIGHAFGLPDLYDVRGGSVAHHGVGTWDLMASGAWGCDNASPESPCHMGAWSKAVLGWVDVVPLDPGLDHGELALPPVQSGGSVYRIDAQDGSGEYFLLENRSPEGFDRRLHDGGGLLVWQIDPVRVSNRWGANTVNGSDTPGIRLREADGQGHLLRSSGGNRGDAGDPFPGATGNVVFHAGSSPATTSYAGTPTGLTVLNIARAGADIGFRLLTRFSTVTLVADGSNGTDDLFAVDGASPQPSGGTFTAAPFSTRSVEAAAGELIEPGVRRPFLQWIDGRTSRSRSVTPEVRDTTVTALYDDTAREVQLSVVLEGGADGIVPATVESFPSSPDLWFREGREISVEVVPRTGFRFLEWTGPLAGASNPAFLTMDTPVSAGADLETTYAVPALSFEPRAATPQELVLNVLNGTGPVAWTVVDGALPDGLTLRRGGLVTGAAAETGAFSVRVRARDAIGLTAEGVVTFEVREPDIPHARAAAHFLLSGRSLTDAEAVFLDRHGNADGRYDLGDFRAWVFKEEGP
ncbi:MAG: M6 family metalloprotease domain-containing protein [Gemmatimonadota bacterium]